jgi:hypothetical protein
VFLPFANFPLGILPSPSPLMASSSSASLQPPMDHTAPSAHGGVLSAVPPCPWTLQLPCQYCTHSSGALFLCAFSTGLVVAYPRGVRPNRSTGTPGWRRGTTRRCCGHCNHVHGRPHCSPWAHRRGRCHDQGIGWRPRPIRSSTMSLTTLILCQIVLKYMF